MTISSIESRQVISVDFTPSVNRLSSNWNPWHVWRKCVNTYNLIKGDGRFQEIFSKMVLDPHLHQYPSFLAPIAIVKDPVIAQKAFEFYRNDKLGIFSTTKSSFSTFIRTVFPELNTDCNILNCSKEISEKLHPFLVSHFNFKNIGSQKELIQAQVDKTLSEWESLHELDLNDETKKLTASVIGKLFLGYQGDYTELTQAVDQVFANLGGVKAKIAQWQIFKHWKTKAAIAKEQELKNAVDVIKKVIDEIITQDTLDEVDSSICAAMKREGIQEDERRAMILTLLLAGQDTTANVLNYILLKLAQDQDLQEAVFNEEISIHDLIREGLRMFTPASLIGRYTNQPLDVQVTFNDSTIKTWHLPKETLFTVAPTLMARDPNIVRGEDLETFNPSRWSKEKNTSFLPNLAWKPFGDGVHRCPGSHIAKQELELFLETLIKNFIISTDVKGELPQKTTFVNRLEGKMPIKIIRRG